MLKSLAFRKQWSLKIKDLFNRFLEGSFIWSYNWTLKTSGISRLEAQKLADSGHLKRFLPAKIYSSPLERAITTGEIALGQDRDNFEFDDRLKERAFGPNFEGKPYDRNVISKIVQMTVEECEKQGIESDENVRQRCASFLADLRRRSDPSVIVFSHGALILQMIKYMVSCNATVPDDQKFKLRIIPYNCDFHQVEMIK